MPLIAARFEQMVPPDGAGFGLVLRMNLDWLEGLGADEEVVSERRQEILSAAERADVVPAEALPDPQDTEYTGALGRRWHWPQVWSRARTGCWRSTFPQTPRA